MRFKAFIGYVAIVFAGCSFADNLAGLPAPNLVDINIAGQPSEPYFLPNKITINLDEQVLLVIDNPYDRHYSFGYDGFGQAVHTHFIQNSPNVSTSTVSLKPRSKVMWLLTPIKEGKYSFFEASLKQTNLKQQPGVIEVVKQPDKTQEQAQAENLPTLPKPFNPLKGRAGGRPD